MRLHLVLDGHLIRAGNLCTGYCFKVGQVDSAPEVRRFPMRGSRIRSANTGPR